MTAWLEAYVLFDPYTGAIAQAGQGREVPRDGLLIAEIVGVDHREIAQRIADERWHPGDGPPRFRVDLATITERGDLPRIALLTEA